MTPSIELMHHLQFGLDATHISVAAQVQQILADPQAHIAALVKAGVLEDIHGGQFPEHRCYVVKQYPCGAWIECGNGRQDCALPKGHEPADVHRSIARVDAQGATLVQDVVWKTNE